MIEYTPLRLTSSEREMAEQNESLRAEIARLRGDRRERIATACMAAFCSLPDWASGPIDTANDAMRYADALIARLDKETTP